jgi:pimeloyl-ACP methyl ester carboxylesterase
MTRAREPDETGYVERDGVRVHWERYGQGVPALFLLPTWTIIHSRFWKGQIPYFADRQTVITFDGRGNGASDRPDDPAAYAPEEFAADALAVMDAARVERCVTVSLSMGTVWNLILCATHPERVAGAVFLGPVFPVAPAPDFMHLPFHEELPADLDGYAFNRSLWLRDHRGFVEWFAHMNIPEAHSSKQLEDYLEWALATTPETLIATVSGLLTGADSLADAFDELIAELRPLARQVRCPSMVLCGEADLVCPPHFAHALAKETGGSLVLVPGAGHVPCCREPVAFNLAVRDFVDEVAGTGARHDPTAHRSNGGGPRALFVSSPIGLGHAQRDVAIARELRALVPGLEIDWLAQDPVTRVLEAEGERIHPGSRRLANESAHLESESGDHDLHIFQSFRRMDEILVANFMVFHDVVESEGYDLWIADEGWEIDHFLHEHPELKRAPFAW